MPSEIPFDPGLVLGNIIDTNKIDELQHRAQILSKKDAAEYSLQQTKQAKSQLTMIKKELINMGIEATNTKMTDLDTKIKDLDNTLVDKALAFADASSEAAAALNEAAEAAEQTQINEVPESPIDFSVSKLISMDLSSDSMSMNVQYVRAEQNSDKEGAHAESISTIVYSSLSGFVGPAHSAKAAADSNAATYQQASKHNIMGTVVITANCTHRRCDMFDPLSLDADKAVSAWNTLHEDDAINIEDVTTVYEAATTAPESNDNTFSVLSGQTTGSSFVGLIHMVQKESSTSSQSSSAISASIGAEIESNLFLRSASGGFGLDSSYSQSLKNLVSSSEVESYVNVFTAGCIPTIASNTVTTTVARLRPDPKEVMGQLDAIQGASDSKVNNSMSAAMSAKRGESFMQLNNSYITNVVSELGSYDNANNRVVDMNSLMTAMDDFVNEAKTGNGGVPINFMVKTITKQDVARSVMTKYYPTGYNQPPPTADEPATPSE